MNSNPIHNHNLQDKLRLLMDNSFVCHKFLRRLKAKSNGRTWRISIFSTRLRSGNSLAQDPGHVKNYFELFLRYSEYFLDCLVQISYGRWLDWVILTVDLDPSLIHVLDLLTCSEPISGFSDNWS